jgi:hypothetical protein
MKIDMIDCRRMGWMDFRNDIIVQLVLHTAFCWMDNRRQYLCPAVLYHVISPFSAMNVLTL